MTASKFAFEVVARSRAPGSRARAGTIVTAHGSVPTPAFVPVATLGAVKAAIWADVTAPLVFMNTLHLMLRPGAPAVREAGGLHRFTGRKGPIITDSGGFQIYSMAAGEMSLPDAGLKGAGQKRRASLVRSVTEEGATFSSYIDGKPITITPESSVEAQKLLGADIILPLDHLLPYTAPMGQVLEAFDRSHRWGERGLAVHGSDPRGQAIFGICHGGATTQRAPRLRPQACAQQGCAGTDVEMRRKSLATLGRAPWDGVAIGGALGETREDMHRMLQAIAPELPAERPVHLLGIGDPRSIELATQLGCDTFDSSYPTRAARHGTAIIGSDGTSLSLRSAQHAHEYSRPVEDGCLCQCCRTHSRAYLRHLVKSREPTGGQLLTLHNLDAMARWTAGLRERVVAGDL